MSSVEEELMKYFRYFQHADKPSASTQIEMLHSAQEYFHQRGVGHPYQNQGGSGANNGPSMTRELPPELPRDGSVVILSDEEEIVPFEPWMAPTQCPNGVTVSDANKDL